MPTTVVMTPSDPTRRTKPWHGVLVATALPMRPSGDDPLAVETCVYDVAATGNEDFVDSSATLQEAVEELPESAPEPVFATEEPDLVPDDDGSSVPWLLVGAIVVVAGVLIVVLVARSSSKKKQQPPSGGPGSAPVAHGSGPPVAGA